MPERVDLWRGREAYGLLAGVVYAAGAAADKACTFHVALCFNVRERRAACTPVDVERVQLKQPNAALPRDAVDAANRDALEGALAALGGNIRGVCSRPRLRAGTACERHADCDAPAGAGNGACAGRFTVFAPPLATADACTGFAAITVPLRSNGLVRGSKNGPPTKVRTT